MIKKDSLEEVWITDVAKKQKSDPILVEKVVRALYLLELLQQSELNFIFKGGTALMLMLTEPKRFSIDIDIIVSNKPENIEEILSKVITDSDFLEFKKDERTIHSNIEKAHYKFYYKPVTNARAEAEYILLDILYEESHYGEHVQQIPIQSLFILTEGEEVAVTVPNPEAILGDKLTAYAPNTTGIPYGRDKEIEIIKQLFDIGHLFDRCENVETISAVFQQFAAIELRYREMNNLTPNDVLEDIFQTSLVICTKGSSGIGKFDELQKGIQNIRNFIFSERFHLDRAIIYAAKAAYVSTLLKTGTKEIQRFKNPLDIADWIIEQPFETRLNKLKKSNPEAFFYWCQALFAFDNTIHNFSDDEIKSLKEVIKYFRAREGIFSNEDPLLKVMEKLDNKPSRLDNFAKDEIKLLLKVINENIEFMYKYEGYNILPQEKSINLKQQVLESLSLLRKRLMNI